MEHSTSRSVGFIGDSGEIPEVKDHLENNKEILKIENES